MSLQRLQSLEEEKPAGQSAQDAGPLTPAQIVEQAAQEYEQIQKELSEIEILEKQSTSEVEKLAQRNAQLTNKLRAMEDNIDTMPRQDIKEIYTAAQEAQMRLFMMRGQVEQLQGEGLCRILPQLGTAPAAVDNYARAKLRHHQNYRCSRK